jgi:hypothetical protein
MKEFLSLKDFLCLLDPSYNYPRSAHCINIQPAQWVVYYDCAKKNWEKFGDSGPPIGTEVITLRPGHGGGEDCLRTIHQIDDGFGGPYFLLSRKHNGCGAYQPLSDITCSIAEVSFWWLHFTVPEFSPFERGRGWRT